VVNWPAIIVTVIAVLSTMASLWSFWSLRKAGIELKEQRAARDAEVEKLREALRGGNATKDNADLLEWFADRLVNEGANPNVDYIRCARDRVRWIRAALATPVAEKEEK